jgi:hypothetical protein
MIKTVQGILQTAASVYVYAYHAGRPCEMLNSGLKMNLHGIGNISVVGSDGRIVCSTLPVLVGVDVSDRHYFHDALAERRLVLSNYLIGKSYGDPSIMAAFPTTVIDSRVEAVIVTSVTLNWLEELVGQTPAATGMTVTLIDGKGTVLASKPAVDDSPAARAVIDQAMGTAGDENSGTAVPAGSSDGRMFASARVPDTNARLIVSIDERATLGSIDRDIRAAYLQLGLVGLLVLVGAWFLSERLIIRPIRLLTNAARPHRAERTAAGVHPAGASLQCDGQAPGRTRTRPAQCKQAALGAGFDRHIVGACQPPRIRQPFERRMDEG